MSVAGRGAEAGRSCAAGALPFAVHVARVQPECLAALPCAGDGGYVHLRAHLGVYFPSLCSSEDVEVWDLICVCSRTVLTEGSVCALDCVLSVRVIIWK